MYGGSLLVDGHTEVSQVLDTNGGACQLLGAAPDGQRSFEYAQSCPVTVSGALTLETSRLNPGSHSLELLVEDAAGNQTVAYNGTITIGGAQAAGTGIGPGSPAALRGAANGTNSSDQAILTARWSATTGATRTSRYGQADRLTGRLNTPLPDNRSPVRCSTSARHRHTEVQTRWRSPECVPGLMENGPSLLLAASPQALRFAYRSEIRQACGMALESGL